MAVLRGPLPAPRLAARELLGALTAAVWLGGHESSERISADGGQPVGAADATATPADSQP